MEFKGKIYKWSKDRNINRKELARRLGVSQTSIRQWEQGETSPKDVFLSRLAHTLNLSITEVGLLDKVDMTTLGGRVKFIRLFRGKSAEQVSLDYGFTPSYYLDLERNRNDHNIAIHRLSSVFKVPESYFDLNLSAQEALDLIGVRVQA